MLQVGSMAYNVFGNPISDETLKGMPKYIGKEITAVDRARVALEMKNAEQKDVNARRYVESIKERWGTGVSTLCLIYNATGGTITYATSHDWFGHLGPAPYPISIANGQWGAYLHVKTSIVAAGSSGAVVYRGKNGAGRTCDWMAAWMNPWIRAGFDNTVYTEIREELHFQDKNNNYWPYIGGLTGRSGLVASDEWGDCKSTVTCGSDTSPILEAIFTLQDA